MRSLNTAGTTISAWPGVEVWQRDIKTGHYSNITADWNWSASKHQHYEVSSVGVGSYWVPTSTNPPAFWNKILIQGTKPLGVHPIDDQGVYRPQGVYIWLPNANIPNDYVPGQYSNTVDCNCPTQYPPQALARVSTSMDLLAEVLAPRADHQPFQDSDGLISFVNLSSSFVTGNPEFNVGREVCDKVSNFFATLRIKVFGFLQKQPEKVLPGDTTPTTQWDSAVTHYMQFLLTQAGGLTNYRVTTESYSATQVITEFSTAFLKLLFDAMTIPREVITDVLSFVQGVGQSLRASWDDRSRNYQTALLGQCHEAVSIDETGNTFIYFPKIKYYYLSVNSSQQAFTSSCASVEKITFNFEYEYYVTGLKASVLDRNSNDYKNFISFLDKAQGISYKDATNNLDAILQNTSSTPSNPKLNDFGINLSEYPRLLINPAKTIERVDIEKILNTLVV